MSSAFSTAIARLCHRLPSKRKLDDYAFFPPNDSDSLAMRISKPPAPFSDHSSSPSSSLPPPPPPLQSKSSSLHFFVRTSSGTLVLHALPSDTIESVIDQIRVITGIPTTPSDHRLIYRGRQLNPDSTLALSGVDTDASLHLTARLRSTRFPRAWRLVHDLDKYVRCLLDNSSIPREIPNIDSVLSDFIASIPTGTNGEVDDTTLEYLQVFILGRAPSCLVRLYASDVSNHKAIADRAIRLFINPAAELLPKVVQARCSVIVLEFCKLIAGTRGKSDPLYVSCRSTLGMLVEAQGGCAGFTNKNMVVELFPFVKELAGITMDGLVKETLFISWGELGEFGNFLVAMRLAVREWMGRDGHIPMSVFDNTSHPRYERWIYSLHAVFLELLGKVDQCLKKVEAFMAENGQQGQNDTRWARWSHVLVVLTNAHAFAKIYEGAPELLHAILLNRRASVNALVRHAKKNEKLRWLLKHKDVIDFEARQSLAMMLFPDGKDDYEHLYEMLIDRSQLLAESFEYIGRVDAQSLHGGLFMEFKNEEATGPGVLREWFCLVCRAIFNPQNVLFLACPNDRRRFFPNPGEFLIF